MKSTKELLNDRLLGPRTKEEINLLDPRILGPRRKTQVETDRIADYLVDKFSSPDYRPIFLRAAWRLDKGTIDRLVAAAFEIGTVPRAYFIASAKADKRYWS